MPSAIPDNDYLGFCKGASKLQNGDRSGALQKYKEAQSWSRNASRRTTLAQHLRCTAPKCRFRSTLISSDADVIFDKVLTYEKHGIKLRWTFLAKSHVMQKVVLKDQYAFKCLFCVFMGLGARAAVYVGTEYYLDHINKDHRCQDLGEVLLYKTLCINDRVADDSEQFDINIWPLGDGPSTQQWLDDSLIGDPSIRPNHLPGPSGLGANQPWIVDINLFDDFDGTQDGHSEDGSITIAPPYPERQDSAICDEKQSAFSYDSWTDNLDEMTRSPSERGFQPYRQQWVHPAYRQVRQGRLGSMSGNQSYDPLSQNTRPSRMSPTPSSCYTAQSLTERSSVDSTHLGIAICIDSVIQVFTESLAVIGEIKRQPRFAGTSILKDLEETVRDAPSEIQHEFQSSKSRLGRPFEAGDATSIMALQQLTGNLHTRLLGMLRRIFSGSLATDVGFLANAADSGRWETIMALHDLRQRISRTAPERSSRAFPPSAMSAFQSPTQHLSHMRPDLWKDPCFPANLGASSRRHSDEITVGMTRRRGSVLVRGKSKLARRLSLSKTHGAESDSEVVPRWNMKARTVNATSEIAELDATPISRG
ncbi:Hypothetical predicted protein [Lecanosticta acicola]|uniref:Uncharacterized protein n=1 Tax=Lecanosticta acicola TaxID=111012 RepID=A0AAI9E8D4_9PEZI|nr:Hypothetical predicted protein [Lecanosticta acicola]